MKCCGMILQLKSIYLKVYKICQYSIYELISNGQDQVIYHIDFFMLSFFSYFQDMICAIAELESDRQPLCTHYIKKSKASSMGIMQIFPKTAEWLVRY